jgi:hypothetical protein
MRYTRACRHERWAGVSRTRRWLLRRRGVLAEVDCDAATGYLGALAEGDDHALLQFGRRATLRGVRRHGCRIMPSSGNETGEVMDLGQQRLGFLTEIDGVAEDLDA